MGKIKVFVIDDSPIYREVLKNIIDSDPLLEYVGFAANGAIAVKKLEFIDPDVITLDIEMPEMNGIETLKHIMKHKPKPVIMISSFTKEGADITLRALELGAVDYIQKPNDNDLEANLSILQNLLLTKIKIFSNFTFKKDVFKEAPPETDMPVVSGLPSFEVPKKRTRPIDVVCIGSSTGGTVALSKILPKIRSDIGVPIVIVQHMPKLYTKSFANRLDSQTSLKVTEAVHGEKLEPNHAYIAPGGLQMSVAHGKIYIEDAPPMNSHKPSVDVLFYSIERDFHDRVLAIILTGMGSDGAKGMAAINSTGGLTVAQDEESCVVFGMPGSAIRTGKVDRIMPLDRIADFINDAVEYANS